MPGHSLPAPGQEVMKLVAFPEARCQECWKTEICEIVGTVERCPFFEPIERQLKPKGGN